MPFTIGIDTGGTYTDAVVYDSRKREVLARGKSPTTHEELAVGIGKALDTLPRELLLKADTVALSTTLATNACVEGKGGRARLLMMGTNRKTLDWIQADQKYGLNYDALICVPEHGDSYGKSDCKPDWDKLMDDNDEFFRQAEAISVVELNAMKNGGVYENAAGEALSGRYNVPFVKANDLVSGLNIMERGATALLNARLLPVVDDFVKAVKEALSVRGLDLQRVIMRSDGSLMSEELAKTRPVETILSGPAASVSGCRTLADEKNALIVDMGGTTTDISILIGGDTRMSDGIKIGGWRTQIQGVYIDTIALGGDTRIWFSKRQLALDNRRVEPICVAASRWPGLKDELRRMIDAKRIHTLPLHEILYLVRMPDNLDRYTEGEKKVISELSKGPRLIGGDLSDVYRPESARLETEGVVMRAGLTPTDIMHIRGDFSSFDAEASKLAARYFLQILPDMEDIPEDLERFCGVVYDLVKKKMYENIVRVFLETTYPKIYGAGIDEQTQKLIEHKWLAPDDGGIPDFFNLVFGAEASLIGVGAPIHIFLPDVAKKLGVKCVIPKDSAVANAIGAAAAEITSYEKVEIRSVYDDFGKFYHIVHARDYTEKFSKMDEAVEAAKEAAKRLVAAEARRRGAAGELRIEVNVDEHVVRDRAGSEIKLGTTVIATASGGKINSSDD